MNEMTQEVVLKLTDEEATIMQNILHWWSTEDKSTQVKKESIDRKFEEALRARWRYKNDIYKTLNEKNFNRNEMK